MLSRLTARIAFVIAIGLLLVCAILVYSTVLNLVESERLVTHTHQVQELLGDTDYAIASAARARLTYVFSGDDEALDQYQHSVARIPVIVSKLRQGTADNPPQQKHCDELEILVNDRIQLWEKSVALKRSGQSSPAGQPDMTRQSVQFADEIVSVTHAMRTEETKLLEQRTTALHVHFVFAVFIMAVTFVAAVLLLLWHYRLLRDELHARERAQKIAAAAANVNSNPQQASRHSQPKPRRARLLN